MFVCIPNDKFFFDTDTALLLQNQKWIKLEKKRKQFVNFLTFYVGF